MQRGELEEVYRRHYRDVYLYAFSLCGNRHDAEELVSETFYRALMSLGKDTPSVKYWLLRVCKNLFLDECRRRGRHPTQPLEEDRPGLDDLTEDLLQKEDSIRLYRCILALPPGYRESIFLFYFWGWNVAQIAAFLNRTPGSVKTLLSRARGKLKTSWEAME